MLLLFVLAGSAFITAQASEISARKGSGAASAAGSQKEAKKKGWFKFNGHLRYRMANGKIIKKSFKKIGGKRFFFNKKGNLVTGWKTIKGKRYFFRKTGTAGTKGAAYSSEWVTIGGEKYYFNKDGSLNENTMTQDEFIKTVGKLARKDMKKSGILASVTVAQAILESGYGTTCLAMEAHNLFGMKAVLSGNDWPSAWDGKTFSKQTLEYYNGRWVTITAPFRAYSEIAESLADHSAYLTHAKNGSALRYKGLVGCKKYRKAIQIIKNGGYATDPAYVNKICNIIQRFKLTKYDRK